MVIFFIKWRQVFKLRTFFLLTKIMVRELLLRFSFFIFYNLNYYHKKKKQFFFDFLTEKQIFYTILKIFNCLLYHKIIFFVKKQKILKMFSKCSLSVGVFYLWSKFFVSPFYITHYNSKKMLVQKIPLTIKNIKNIKQYIFENSMVVLLSYKMESRKKVECSFSTFRREHENPRARKLIIKIFVKKKNYIKYFFIKSFFYFKLKKNFFL